MMRAMLAPARSDVVLPYKLARQAGSWRGRVALDQFERLGALVTGAATAVVDVDLGFRRDEEGRTRADGRVTVTASVECGRCLLPQPCLIDVTIQLCIVATDAEAAKLGGQVDPFVLDGEEVRIKDLVEDDLILGVPQQVCSRGDDCPDRPRYTYGDASADGGAETRNNPFASLADLVGKRR